MIRKGTCDDAAAMAAIYNYYVATSTVIFSNKQLSDAEMLDKIKRLEIGQRFPFLIAEDNGIVLGYAYAHYYHPDPVYSGTWELTMYLDKNARGKGIGGKMLKLITEECFRAGAYTVLSCITEGNEPCERMHKTLGFQRVGCLMGVGYKMGQRLNDVIYQKISPKCL